MDSKVHDINVGRESIKKLNTTLPLVPLKSLILVAFSRSGGGHSPSSGAEILGQHLPYQFIPTFFSSMNLSGAPLYADLFLGETL